MTRIAKINRLILGIETSCDETAAAVVSADRDILSSRVFSQLEEHRPYGGVVPEIAARAHMEKLDAVVLAALSEAGTDFASLEAIAVTAGPGLIGGVIVGVMAAKAYASVHRKPLYAVNHLAGHALTVRLTHEVAFPYLLLLVSGGHCQLIAVESITHYRILGKTRDDALGEAFDKTAKMMGLAYPGGPAVEALAREGDPARFSFPQPLLRQPGCDFSFSGLKTAVRHTLLELDARPGGVTPQDKSDVAASFQHTVAQVLRDRVGNALGEYAGRYGDTGNTLVAAGGVAANRMLRSVLQELAASRGFSFIAPPGRLCTDNAAMIAWAAWERRLANLPPDDASFEPRARWPLGEVAP